MMPKNKESTRYFSTLQEEKVASLIDGYRTSNSGAGLFQKGDVYTNHLLVECKTPTTEKESFSIKKEWLDKNKEEAKKTRKSFSALAFCFKPNGENYFVIDENLFKYLNQKINEEFE